MLPVVQIGAAQGHNKNELIEQTMNIVSTKQQANKLMWIIKVKQQVFQTDSLNNYFLLNVEILELEEKICKIILNSNIMQKRENI